MFYIFLGQVHSDVYKYAGQQYKETRRQTAVPQMTLETIIPLFEQALDHAG